MTKRKRNGAAGMGQKPKKTLRLEVVGRAPRAITLPPFPEGFPREAPAGEALNALPQVEFKGKIHLVNRENEDVDWSRLEAAPILGFDTETKPSFVKGAAPNPTALVQLATEGECWIFQLLQPYGASKATLRRLQALLQAPLPVKAGVGLPIDYRDLCVAHFPSMRSAEGLLDLQEIVKPYVLRQTGLRALAAIFLCRHVSKAQQTSNWGSQHLSNAQLWYAAADAWLGWRLHQTLRSLFEGSEVWAPPAKLTISDA